MWLSFLSSESRSNISIESSLITAKNTCISISEPQLTIRLLMTKFAKPEQHDSLVGNWYPNPLIFHPLQKTLKHSNWFAITFLKHITPSKEQGFILKARTFPPNILLLYWQWKQCLLTFQFFSQCKALCLKIKYPTMGILANGSHKGNCFDQGQLIY